ncbi:MAG: pro-sigmaK processing inhibitor BofA family protein [Firmicutes bacterium]|nr:pro-sigmaK processing inhibitor BofA family protein [Bacillota bacterium]
METISSILILAAVVVGVILLLKILSAPIRLAFKLLINAGVGFLILFVVNFFGDFVGFTLGVNFLNALVAGILGVPGVILLIVIKLFF